MNGKTIALWACWIIYCLYVCHVLDGLVAKPKPDYTTGEYKLKSIQL